MGIVQPTANQTVTTAAGSFRPPCPEAPHAPRETGFTRFSEVFKLKEVMLLPWPRAQFLKTRPVEV